MKKTLLRFFSLLVLIVVVHTTTVKEIHFLFLNHSEFHDEQCSNHLHDYTHHDNCSFCKIDLPFSTEAIYAEYHHDLAFTDCFKGLVASNIPLCKIFSTCFLRGPPLLFIASASIPCIV